MSLQCIVWNVFEQNFGVFLGEFWIRRETTIPYAKIFFFLVFLFIKKNIYQKTNCAGSYCSLS